MRGTDWEKTVAERDEKIAALEAQVAEVAKNVEAAEHLRGEIAELKAQGESDRIDFKLQLVGVRNVKAARAVLADHGGDIDALKEAEPWLFADIPFTQPGGKTGPTHRQHLTSATFAANMAGFSHLNLNYLFYSCTSLASVNGLCNLSGVRSMHYMFSSCAFTTIDFRGFDPSTLTDLFYTFSGCSHMTTIYADATWALPTSGIMGSQCFYSCSTSLIGGNGIVWASNKTAYTYFRIDTTSTLGAYDAI